MKNDWTDAHRREAMRAIMSAIIDYSATRTIPRHGKFAHVPCECFGSKSATRKALARCNLSNAEARRVLRRIDALAEGRLVREEAWAIRWRHENGSTFIGPRFSTRDAAANEIARRHAKGLRVSLARVTSIRRAR